MEGGAGGQVKERGCRRRKVTAGRAGGRGEAEQDELRNHGPTAGRTDGACGRPGSSPGYRAPAAAMEQRLRALEQLVRGEAGGSPGLDGLLDLLLGVHHELSSAPLRRERNVAQFLSWGEWSGKGGWRDNAWSSVPPDLFPGMAYSRNFLLKMH